MRSSFVVILLALGALSRAQARLAVTVRGHPAGYATVSQSIEKDGVKVVNLRMELTSGDRKVQLTTEARYDAKGMPMRKFQQAIIAGGALNKQVIVTYPTNGAHAVILDGDKRVIKTIDLAATAPRANLSEFWFIRDQPKKGQVEKTYQFNIDSLEWELVTTEFRGKKTLKFEGRAIAVNEVVSVHGDKETTAYLDAQGLPVLIDLGDTKMVKIWQK